MEIYNKLKTPPATALKTIADGRLKGKSDINPQWRYEVMTEVFGMCGFGWKYVVTNKRFETGSEGQVAVFVDVELYVKQDKQWSDPIPGNGGSMFVTNERRGPYTSDEAVKMATTDALSVAMKMLGVGADVYRGVTDKTPPQTKYDKPQEPAPQGPPAQKEILKESTEKFAEAVNWLLERPSNTIDRLRKRVEISKEVEQSLINAVKAKQK